MNVKGFYYDEEEKNDNEEKSYSSKHMIQQHKPSRGIVDNNKLSVALLAAEMAKDREQIDKILNKQQNN